MGVEKATELRAEFTADLKGIKDAQVQITSLLTSLNRNVVKSEQTSQRSWLEMGAHVYGWIKTAQMGIDTVIGLGKSFFDMMTGVAQATKEIEDAANWLGITVEKASELDLEARMVGVGMGGLERAAGMLSSAIEQGIKTDDEAIKKKQELQKQVIALSGDMKDKEAKGYQKTAEEKYKLNAEAFKLNRELQRYTKIAADGGKGSEEAKHKVADLRLAIQVLQHQGFEKLHETQAEFHKDLDKDKVKLSELQQQAESITTGGKGGIFERLGLDPKSLKAMASTDAMDAVFKALKNVQNASERMAMMRGIWGRQAVALNELMFMDPKRKQAMTDWAKQWKWITESTDISKAEEWRDEMLKMSIAWEGFQKQLFRTAQPGVSKGIETIFDAVLKNKDALIDAIVKIVGLIANELPSIAALLPGMLKDINALIPKVQQLVEAVLNFFHPTSTGAPWQNATWMDKILPNLPGIGPLFRDNPLGKINPLQMLFPAIIPPGAASTVNDNSNHSMNITVSTPRDALEVGRHIENFQRRRQLMRRGI